MITLDKITGMGMGTETPTPTPTLGTTLPGHVEGLRANDLVTLHSAIVCNAVAGNIGLSIQTTPPQGKASRITERIHQCSWCTEVADYMITTPYGDEIACRTHTVKHFPDSI